MPLFACGRCGQSIQAADDDAGYEVECPRCRASIVVPGQKAPRPLRLPQSSPRQFPALSMTATGYEILSWVAVVLGALLAVLVLVGQANMPEQPPGAGLFVVIVELTIIVSTALLWLTLKASAEMIRLAIHVEHAAHQVATAVRAIAENTPAM